MVVIVVSLLFLTIHASVFVHAFLVLEILVPVGTGSGHTTPAHLLTFELDIANIYFDGVFFLFLSSVSTNPFTDEHVAVHFLHSITKGHVALSELKPSASQTTSLQCGAVVKGIGNGLVVRNEGEDAFGDQLRATSSKR
jgi:hypothetical protein